VKTCIMLGHELNMCIVAEGVESETTLIMLKEMGCDIAQGYFISRPLSEENFHIWLQENPSKDFRICS
ncbi:MAG: EAL domain-containing protein (putative c-di-GMP-specific phosphodiesterase class I), partial [Enterobacterales bacterium]